MWNADDVGYMSIQIIDTPRWVLPFVRLGFGRKGHGRRRGVDSMLVLLSLVPGESRLGGHRRRRRDCGRRGDVGGSVVAPGRVAHRRRDGGMVALGDGGSCRFGRRGGIGTVVVVAMPGGGTSYGSGGGFGAIFPVFLTASARRGCVVGHAAYVSFRHFPVQTSVFFILSFRLLCLPFFK
jgi:hypothetical protein